MRAGVASVLILAAVSAALWAQAGGVYLWRGEYKPAESLSERIRPPEGFRRAEVPAGSFEAWLRGLPLKPGRPPVLLFDGRKKGNQEAHAAVVDIDVGSKDLQQCADSVIRLRAEWLYAAKRYAEIHFNFTSGERADFRTWAEGSRPTVRGNTVTWRKTVAADSSYPSFRAYLDTVFTYAGTASLNGELADDADAREMRIGDVFIHPGTPGHAVIVADVAEQGDAREKVFLLVQGFMPAQEMHVLRNPKDPKLSPWYRLDLGDALKTPEWTFRWDELKRW